jgi:hypothetical protein
MIEAAEVQRYVRSQRGYILYKQHCRLRLGVTFFSVINI